MTYSFKCTCGHISKVEADNDDDAMAKMMVAGGQHMESVHPDWPKGSDEEMKEMVKAGWWKE